MTSKECLEHICKNCDNKCCPYIHYEKSRCGFYGVIRQDLDRLEKLETGNAKLKKVIEILKDELEISFEDTTQDGNGYWAVLKNWSGEEEVVINFNTPNNYELLKEVLEDE